MLTVCGSRDRERRGLGCSGDEVGGESDVVDSSVIRGRPAKASGAESLLNMLPNVL